MVRLKKLQKPAGQQVDERVDEKVNNRITSAVPATVQSILKDDTMLVNDAERMFQMTFSEEEIPVKNYHNNNVRTMFI